MAGPPRRGPSTADCEERRDLKIRVPKDLVRPLGLEPDNLNSGTELLNPIQHSDKDHSDGLGAFALSKTTAPRRVNWSHCSRRRSAVRNQNVQHGLICESWRFLRFRSGTSSSNRILKFHISIMIAVCYRKILEARVSTAESLLDFLKRHPLGFGHDL